MPRNDLGNGAILAYLWHLADIPMRSADGRFWGHQGLFESIHEPPTPPPMPAPDPNHAPLQVIDGNYERMSGVCPWWDAVKRSSRPI